MNLSQCGKRLGVSLLGVSLATASFSCDTSSEQKKPQPLEPIPVRPAEDLQALETSKQPLVAELTKLDSALGKAIAALEYRIHGHSNYYLYTGNKNVVHEFRNALDSCELAVHREFVATSDPGQKMLLFEYSKTLGEARGSVASPLNNYDGQTAFFPETSMSSLHGLLVQTRALQRAYARSALEK